MPHYSQNPSIFPLHGGCVCGLTRYTLTLPPLLVHCCSCTACQRQTGAPLALNAVIESTALTLQPASSPTVPGYPSAPDPVAAGFLPAIARTTAGTPATEYSGSPKPVRICIPTESGLGQTIVQCPACGTTLWNYYADAGPYISYLRVGTLDHPWELEPDVHLFMRSRFGFLKKVEDGKPQFDEYYPDRMELLRPEAKERVKALGDKVEAWQAEVYKDIPM